MSDTRAPAYADATQMGATGEAIIELEHVDKFFGDGKLFDSFYKPKK